MHVEMGGRMCGASAGEVECRRQTRLGVQVPAEPRTPSAHTSRGAHAARLCPALAYSIMHAEMGGACAARVRVGWNAGDGRAAECKSLQRHARQVRTNATALRGEPPPSEKQHLNGTTAGRARRATYRCAAGWLPVRASAGPQPCHRGALTPAAAHHGEPLPSER
jgi:hypothetical protein